MANTDIHPVGSREHGLRRIGTITPSERAVAVLFCQGKSLKEIARERKVSYNTVRAHVRSMINLLLTPPLDGYKPERLLMLRLLELLGSHKV